MPDTDPTAPADHPAVTAAQALIVRLRSEIDDPDAAKEALLALAMGPDGGRVREHIEAQHKLELLEVQWELEEVLEAATPKAAEPPAPEPDAEPEPEPEPAPDDAEDPNKQLSAADLNLVYDDPRGLMLHKTRKGPDRWFATQNDPRTGQPQTFELHASEIEQLKGQLDGSPYWLLGAGS